MARWLLLGAVACLALLGTVLVPLGSSGVRDVAEQFQPPPDATPYESRVTPRRVICLGASPCPSLFQSWTLPRRVDQAEFLSLLAAAGWQLEEEGDCRPSPNRFARMALCSATGEVDGFAVTVSQLGESRTEQTVLTLDVRPPG